LSVAAYVAGSGLHCRGAFWDEEGGAKDALIYRNALAKAKTKQPMQNFNNNAQRCREESQNSSASSVDAFLKYTPKYR
jgi:hypothetical protein